MALASSGQKTGLEGLEKVQEVMPDIIFLDYHMPGMDGLEVTRRVQNKYGNEKIKIVMVSASTFAHHREQYMKEGLHGFVGKPFMREEIFGVMARLLNIEYKYEEDDSSPKVKLAEDINYSAIKLPEVLHASIKKMACVGMLVELEEYLPDVKRFGPEGLCLAVHLKEMVDRFDADGIIKVMEKINNE
jgi:CheY-like chemotaxis protein